MLASNHKVMSFSISLTTDAKPMEAVSIIEDPKPEQASAEPAPGLARWPRQTSEE